MLFSPFHAENSRAETGYSPRPDALSACGRFHLHLVAGDLPKEGIALDAIFFFCDKEFSVIVAKWRLAYTSRLGALAPPNSDALVAFQ